MATTKGTEQACEHGGQIPPGKPMGVEQHMLDKGAQMMQSLKPIKGMNQHVCTFAMYSHDVTRQIETHHYATRINQDFLHHVIGSINCFLGQPYCIIGCVFSLILILFDRFRGFVYAGVEYIVSDKIFETLSPDEQKLWHSHAYEVTRRCRYS
ncbi:hypothetical protein F511_45804 [Dorcoceras hygrometricum]|uniref:Uncharacterized protein n=1 Tax=Dorcoceras hygrometricum TaxID=472368 RepID=A0A2Z7A264_9LAMI|nr:hypothetical protein F511_45804 [Dorcoceras hygrometricum]